MMTITANWDDSGGDDWLNRRRAFFSDPAELNAIMEVAAADVVKQHMAEQYATRPNKLGGASTGYWKSAIEGTTSTSGADGLWVRINQVGVKLKYHGGVITASGRTSEVTGKPIRMLSIPVHAAAHGRTIADLGGRRAFYHKGGGIFFKAGDKRSSSDPLYYILRKSVRIKSDQNILPPDGAILNGCMRALAAALPSD